MMKHILLLLCLTSLGVQAKEPFEKNSTDNFRAIKKTINELKKCATKCIPIFQNDFKDATGRLTKSLEIKEPGTYCLTESIPFEANEIITQAIRINSNDVTLDLCGYVLSQSNKGPEMVCSGILIENEVSNISILGSYGTIRDFSSLGIEVIGNNKNIQIGDRTSLTITNCGGSTPEAFLFETFISPVTSYEGGIAFGSTKYLADQGFPTRGPIDTIIMKNVHIDGNSFGAWFGNTSNISCTNCTFNNNKNTRISGATLFGQVSILSLSTLAFGLASIAALEEDTGMVNAQFTDCSFNGNFAEILEQTDGTSNSIAFGILATNKHENLSLQRCSFNGTIADSQKGNLGLSIGCLVAGGQGTKISSCKFCSNKAGSIVLGFSQLQFLSEVEGTDPIINPALSLFICDSVASENCATTDLANQLNLPDVVLAFGYSFENSSGITLKNSIATNNQATIAPEIDSVVGIAFGVAVSFLSMPSTNIVIDQLHSSGNRSNKLLQSAGVFTNPFQEQVLHIKKSTCTNNGETDNELNSFGIIALNNDEQKQSLVMESNIIQDQDVSILFFNIDNGVIKDNLISQSPFSGIVLEECMCTTVLKNMVSHCTEGIIDMSNPSDNLIAQNKVFNSEDADSSYNVTYPFAPFPERRGSFTCGFPTDAEVCDNVGIVKDTACVESEKTVSAKETSNVVKEKLVLMKGLLKKVGLTQKNFLIHKG